MIYTIGHSTHAPEAFLTLLRAHQVIQVADVRAVPRSRRLPHFGREALSEYLEFHGITYRHFPELGGLRHPQPQSENTAWQHPGFRGYADYMQTPAFHRAVESFIQFAGERATAAMCAESVWWKCHRRLLADAVVARGVKVAHILSSAAPKPHALSDFAQVSGASVRYPGLVGKGCPFPESAGAGARRLADTS